MALIASSPTNPKKVLDTIAESAMRLCRASAATIWRRDGDWLVAAHQHGETAQRHAEVDFTAMRRDVLDVLTRAAFW
ncbi:MAG: hypothetical protein U0893_15080 [Chloroflexota bacterium]